MHETKVNPKITNQYVKKIGTYNCPHEVNTSQQHISSYKPITLQKNYS